MAKKNWDFSDSSGRQVEQKLLRKILKVVCDKKAVFASEVAHHTAADVGKVASIMRQLEEADVLEILQPKMKHGDPRLLSASKRTGKRSIEQMRQPTWYGLNSSIDWELKVNNRDLSVDEYHNIIDDPEGTEKSLLDYAVNRMES